MICELCQCEESYNFHHFIPKTVHSNKWFKKRYNREQMSQGINVCRSCHKTIHNMIPDEKQLARDYNTRTKLAAHQKIKKFLKWKRGRSEKVA